MQKFSKIFPRFKISTKLVLAFLGMGVIPFILLGSYSVISMSSTLEGQALEQLRFQIKSIGRDIRAFLGNIEHDLFYLKSSASLQRLADLTGTDSPENPFGLPDMGKARLEVEKEFLRFSQGKRNFYQIRYLDMTGREIVRLNHDDSGVYVVPKAQLQDKGGRYYFKEAVALKADEIYVSPMDLNIEWGLVEIPQRPVIRYASPVLNSRGGKVGILIINIFAEPIFEIISGVPEKADSFLIDRKGLYLYQSSATSTAHYFKNQSIHDDYSQQIVSDILHNSSGLTNTIHHILVYSRILKSSHADDWWTMIIAVPNKIVFASSNHLKRIWLSALTALILLGAFFGIVSARHFIKPIFALTKGADRIAGGAFDHHIKVETNDELEDLARHFNNMAHQLKETQERLQHWNLELKNEVEKRTKRLELSEATLKIENQKLDDIVSSIGAELCLIDFKKNIVWANKILTDRYDGEGSVVGQNCYKIFNERSDPCPECCSEICFSERTGHSAVISCSNGNKDRRFFQLVATPVMNIENEVDHLLELRLDITDSVLTERMLEKQQVEKLHLESQVEMAAGVIHEVAKPLSAIKTTLQVLEEETLSEKYLDYLNGIEDKINQLGEFLKTFSIYARPKTLDLQLCRIEEIIEQVLLLIRPDAERRGVRICENYSQQTELPEVELDSIQIQQVLYNIITNAFEAMPDGGTVTISADNLREPVFGLQLTISDTGTGISEDDVNKIFKPFYSTKADGAGLGLSIVRQIMYRHGGNITVENNLEKGTSFILTLPVQS